MELNAKTLTVKKSKVCSCAICGMKRLSRNMRDNSDSMVEDGLVITVKNDAAGIWDSEKESHMCQVCMNNIIKAHNVIVQSKLVIASIHDDKYINNENYNCKNCDHIITPEDNHICPNCEAPHIATRYDIKLDEDWVTENINRGPSEE